MHLNFIKIRNLLYLVALSFAINLPLAANTEQSSDSELVDQSSHLTLVNSSVTLSELTLTQLRSIFSLRARRWEDGTPIRLVVLADENTVHREFTRSVLKMLTHQLRRHWDRYIYSGTGQGPIVVTNQKEMIAKLKQLKGAIGYVEKGVSHETLRVISIH